MYKACDICCSSLSMLWDHYGIFKDTDHDLSSFVHTWHRSLINVKVNWRPLNRNVIKFYFLYTSKQEDKLTFFGGWSKYKLYYRQDTDFFELLPILFFLCYLNRKTKRKGLPMTIYSRDSLCGCCKIQLSILWQLNPLCFSSVHLWKNSDNMENILNQTYGVLETAAKSRPHQIVIKRK